MDIVLDPNILFLDQQGWDNSASRALFAKQLMDLLKFIESTPFKILFNSETSLLLHSNTIQPWKFSADSASNAVSSLIIGLLIRSRKIYDCPAEPEECLLNPEIRSLIGGDAVVAFLKLIYNLSLNREDFFLYLSQYNIHCLDGLVLECKCGSITNNATIIENISSWIQQDVFLNHLMNSLAERAWRPVNEYFPNSALLNKIIPSNAEIISTAKRYPSQRNALSKARGTVVAMINGYKHDKRLSKINSTNDKLREIFYAGSGNGKIYLSIDVKSLAFELCDYNGKHIGEFNFDGKPSKVIDTEGGHDLKIK